MEQSDFLNEYNELISLSCNLDTDELFFQSYSNILEKVASDLNEGRRFMCCILLRALAEKQKIFLEKELRIAKHEDDKVRWIV